jgi:transcriptional regulator GlxA family with amidase domain
VKISIIAFDDFTDIDVFFMWDLLNRVKRPDWQVAILGEAAHHRSISGLIIPTHGTIEEANAADAVLFASGQGTRRLINNEKFLSAFKLNPEKQLIGSMCSGALILAALGFLQGKRATTYPTVKRLLESFGVEVVEKAFVLEGNIATAAGCLAAQQLAGWVIEKLVSAEMKEVVLRSIMPVGEGLSFEDEEEMAQVYDDHHAERTSLGANLRA